MKIFIYKLLISLLFLYVFFEFTIGSRINYFTDKIDIFTDHESRIEFKEKIKSEIKKGIEKDCWQNQPSAMPPRKYHKPTGTQKHIRQEENKGTCQAQFGSD